MNCVPGGLWVIFHHIQCGNAGQMLSDLSYSSDTLICLICEETPGLSKHSHGCHQQIMLQQEYVVLFLHIVTLLEKKHFMTSGWRGEGIKKKYNKQWHPPLPYALGFSFSCSFFHFQYLHLDVLTCLVSSEVTAPGKQLGKASFAARIPIQLSADMKTRIAQDDRWPWQQAALHTLKKKKRDQLYYCKISTKPEAVFLFLLTGTKQDRGILNVPFFSERRHCLAEAKASQESSSQSLSSRLRCFDHILPTLLRSPEPVLKVYSTFYALHEFWTAVHKSR